MKILIVGSCTSKKKFKHTKQPTCENLTTKEDITKFVAKYPEMSCRAIDMYTGNQHISLTKAIKILDKYSEINYYIVSAGYGLIHSDEIISSYNCSFMGMLPDQIIERAIKLKIDTDFQDIIKKDYDFIYLALGQDYLLSVGEWKDMINCPIIVFQGIKKDNLVCLEANNETVKKYSNYGYKINGVNGFKGDLLLIIAKLIQQKQNPKALLTNLTKNTNNLLVFIKNEIEKPINKSILDF